MDRDETVLLEELNLNAWPALKTVHLDGWLLRSAGGETRRPNSVNIFGRSTIPLADKIAAAEAIYRNWSRPCIFRVTPLVDVEIPGLLDARGYASEGATFVQTAALCGARMPERVELIEQVSEEWIHAALDIRGVRGAGERDIFRSQHRAIGVAATWALMREGSRALACGCATAERGWSGLTGIYVHAEARRRGLARAVTQALLSWAAGKGARQTWLQVEQTNAAAVALYASLGFRTKYHYHYRMSPKHG
jgi:ribosomal protein S18 acetylase RimI-like enzyme